VMASELEAGPRLRSYQERVTTAAPLSRIISSAMTIQPLANLNRPGISRLIRLAPYPFGFRRVKEILQDDRGGISVGADFRIDPGLLGRMGAQSLVLPVKR
jgi:hypothetical protein